MINLKKNVERYVFVLEPCDQQVNVKVVFVGKDKPALSLDKMYELIGCHCIDIRNACKEIANILGRNDLLLIFDDEFLLTDEPVVNYGASFLNNSVLCGNVVIAQDFVDEQGERNSRGFAFEEVTDLLSKLFLINKVLYTMPTIKVPEPHISFKTF